MKLPTQIKLNVVIGEELPVAEVLNFALEALVARDGFKPDYWCLLSEMAAARKLGDENRAGVPSAADIDALGEKAFADGFSIEGANGGLTAQNIARLGGADDKTTFGAAKGWRLMDTRFIDKDAGEAGYFAALGMQHDILQAAMAKLPVFRADIRRFGTAPLGPNPPHAAPNVLVAVVQAVEIERDYAEPSEYWEAWDRVEYLNAGLALVSRGMEVADDTDFKRRILPGAFAMARAAKTGLTKYAAPLLNKADSAMVAEFGAYLQQVGYDSNAKSLEFTAVLPADEHLSPGDVYSILEFLEDGTGDDEEVEEVIVTFPDKTAAEREAPLLREIGATAQYFAEDGSWKRL